MKNERNVGLKKEQRMKKDNHLKKKEDNGREVNWETTQSLRLENLSVKILSVLLEKVEMF